MKRELTKIFAAFLLTGTVLAGCGSDDKTEEKDTTSSQQDTDEVEKEEEADFAASFEEAKAELSKAKEGQDVDFDLVSSIYTDNLQELVQKRDQEFEDSVDEHISTALTAGKTAPLIQWS